MDRRSFIKGLIALASAPAIGKYVNVFKTEGAREGIEQVASQGVDFFNMVIKKVMDEGTLVKEEDRISTFKHPDRPDITVDINQTDGTSSVFFDTDQGSKAGAEIIKTMDETTKGRTVEELMESEEVYKMGGDEYYKDVQEEITGGITNLEEFLKRKKGFAMGGRVGMFRGGIPKGLQAAMSAIMSKHGDDAITTADRAPQPEKTIQEEIMDFNTRNPNPNRQMTPDEYDDFIEDIGGEERLEAYNFDGTVGDAERILKEDRTYFNEMELEYKKGNLDPKPGEANRERFLEKKLEDAEMSGDTRLITRDEIEELEELKAIRKSEYKPGDAITSENFGNTGFAPDMEARKLAPKMIERMELKRRYPGITDELLDSILIDDNPQRKAEVLATLDEIFTMMNKGKGADEILSMFKNINRTKQADGGIIDLTAIKIPDNSKSGVESLFKRR